jgi:hypothetical protein
MIAEKQSYEDILLKIKDSQPLPAWYKNAYNGSLITVICISYVSSITLMALWIYDLFEKTNLCNFEICDINSYIYEPGYEYAILALFLGTIVYFLYRSTDWPFVKERSIILLLLILVGSGLSFSTAIWLNRAHDPISDSLYEIKNSIKASLPWRYNLQTYSIKKLRPVIGNLDRVDLIIY